MIGSMVPKWQRDAWSSTMRAALIGPAALWLLNKVVQPVSERREYEQLHMSLFGLAPLAPEPLWRYPLVKLYHKVFFTWRDAAEIRASVYFMFFPNKVGRWRELKEKYADRPPRADVRGRLRRAWKELVR